MKQFFFRWCFVLLLSCVSWSVVQAQYFELPQKPVKKVKLHPLEKKWMKQGMQLRIQISALSNRYKDKHPKMVQHIRQYRALIQEVKRLRFLLKRKVKVQGFLTILLQQTLQLEMKIAMLRVFYLPKQSKLKVALVQQRLLKDRLRGWLKTQKYKGPLYPPLKRKSTKRK